MGERKDTHPQGGQIVPIAGHRVPVQVQSGQKTVETLQHQKVLGDLSPVKCAPELQVDVVIEFSGFRRVRNFVGLAQTAERAVGGLGKIKQCIICIEEQIGIVHGSVPPLED